MVKIKERSGYYLFWIPQNLEFLIIPFSMILGLWLRLFQKNNKEQYVGEI